MIDTSPLYDGLKYWLPVASGSVLIIRAAFWLRGIREKIDMIKDNHLVHIEESLAALPDNIAAQTSAIVAELRSHRQDEAFRELSKSIETLPGNMPRPDAPNTSWVNTLVDKLDQIGETIKSSLPSEHTLRQQTERIVQAVHTSAPTPAVLDLEGAIEKQTKAIIDALNAKPVAQPTNLKIEAPKNLTEQMSVLIAEMHEMNQNRGRVR